MRLAASMTSVRSSWQCALIPASHIAVEHKDRCGRFGVAYIQTLRNTPGRDLVSINEADTGPADVRQDFGAISTAFTARLYGRRRASRQKTQLLAALEGT
jgi:predicted site-specific integrase-resolvase